jgi:hypothetical protein
MTQDDTDAREARYERYHQDPTFRWLVYQLTQVLEVMPSISHYDLYLAVDLAAESYRRDYLQHTVGGGPIDSV